MMRDDVSIFFFEDVVIVSRPRRIRVYFLVTDFSMERLFRLIEEPRVHTLRLDDNPFHQRGML